MDYRIMKMWHGHQGMAAEDFPLEIDQSTNMTKYTSL
jgi:hypothetical protein